MGVKTSHPRIDKTAPARTREHQYDGCFDEAPVTLGPMTGASWRWNPRRLGMMLARYKFVAKMLEGQGLVAEIGCSDGFASPVVGQAVTRLDLYDFDPVWRDAALASGHPFRVHDILHDGPLPAPGTLTTTIAEADAMREAMPSGKLPIAWRYGAIYMLDVLEHIHPNDEPRAMRNITASLKPDGVFIAGCPSLESQKYAAEISLAGHVNCRTGEGFRRDMRNYFDNVFLFGMNDEVLHTGFAPMCHYLFVLCTGPRAAG